MQNKSVIIIGAGQAGAACANELRACGFAGRIVILGDEQHMPYERPELSKKLATGQKTLGDVTILDAAKADEKRIEILTECAALNIDRVSKTVETDTGSYPYDFLVLATGGRARELPQAGETRLPVVSVRTFEDSERLKSLMASAQSVAVVGGGWLGLEAAATCREAGLGVTVLEMADRLCARVAPPSLSQDLLDIHQSRGVEVLLGATVALKPGCLETDVKILEPDFIVAAIGMEANDQLAADAGLETERGILVDQDFRTSDTSIFAIGDCAAVRQTEGSARRSESWQNANQSAAHAAAVICGNEPKAKAPDWFWSDQFGINIQMIGGFGGASNEIAQPSGEGKIVFHLNGDTLCGAYAINAHREIAKCRRNLAMGKLRALVQTDSSISFLT